MRDLLAFYAVCSIRLRILDELTFRNCRLAGIAGESDLDAPDLNAPGTPEPRLSQRAFSSFNLLF
jgi:hypothetical protein